MDLVKSLKSGIRMIRMKVVKQKQFKNRFNGSQ